MLSKKLTELNKAISTRQIAFILLCWIILFNFIVSASFSCPALRLILANYWASVLLLVGLGCLLIFVFLSLLLAQNKPNPSYPLIILSPIILLSLWPVQETSLSVFIPLLIIIITQIIFYRILFGRRSPLSEAKPNQITVGLLVIIALYFLVFSYLGVKIFNAFNFFNPKDFGLFNQIFWNTIHGRFFLNSTYGSHFSCHNSPFYLFLAPFYYLIPNPLTLLILKTMSLALTAIPFYLITKDILKERGALLLAIAFLFFPYIAGQNFTPPHEEGFAALFILFTYYFFRKNKFLPFLCFLLIMISIKESLAPIAVGFGCYAFFEKRKPAWIIYPILIGVIWFVISILLINYFQGVYQPHSDSAWFFVYLKKAFVQNNGSPLASATYLLSHSNLFQIEALKFIFLLFLPLGILPPLLSPVSLLGLPEFALNLFSSNPRMFSPTWHYSIALSCFILIGTAQGIKNISSFICNKGYFKINKERLELLLCVFVVSCTLISSYSWIRLVNLNRDAIYVNAAKEVLSFVPPNASISVPSRIAIAVSGRERYSILGSDSNEDYILIDKSGVERTLKTKIASNYEAIFHKEPLVLYERKN